MKNYNFNNFFINDNHVEHFKNTENTENSENIVYDNGLYPFGYAYDPIYKYYWMEKENEGPYNKPIQYYDFNKNNNYRQKNTYEDIENDKHKKYTDKFNMLFIPNDNFIKTHASNFK